MAQRLERSAGAGSVSIDAREAGEPGGERALTLTLDVEPPDPRRRVDAILEEAP